MIYLDNAATTFPKPELVYMEMDKVNRNYAVNAGRGSYKLAQNASKLIDETKSEIAKMVRCDNAASVVLVPSVTIALNQILNGICFASGDVVYVSPYEHNAVARTLHLISKRKGILIRELPLKEKTLEIDLDKMKYLFSKETPRCVCVNHVSNVTGYILPVNEILDISKASGAITVLDASQSMGLLNIDLRSLKADFMAFAGHKTLYGPLGVGGFVINGDVVLDEFIVGGTGSDSLNLDMPQNSPGKYEAASSNIVAIAGLNAAIKWLDIDKVFEHEKMLTDYLVEQLEKVPKVKVYRPVAESHISIVSFNVEGYKAEDVAMILDEDFDIAVRAGYHCAPYVHKYLDDENTLGTVRVGISIFNNEKEVDTLVNSIRDL
ncbi:MAG: aminotransferase class V-fold PLP-dependent enzyme [Lachnospiraceae bacterium]